MTPTNPSPDQRARGERAGGGVRAAERPGARAEVHRIVAAYQAGIDRDRNFHFLFASYHRPLQRFFARKGLPPESCRDLTQETFVGIYRGLETYRPEARFETWLYRIATTTYLKSLRSRAAGKRSGQEVAAADVEGREAAFEVRGGQLDAVLEAERQRALRAAVGELPPKMRRCLKLRLYHELSYQEIAATMRLPVDTVKAHLYQARGKLKERLADSSDRSSI